MGWLKKGAEGHAEIVNADAKQAEAAKNANIRHWMKPGTERRVTFLDGDLGDDGLIEVNMYYEHNLYLAGTWTNWFVCVGEEEPCPICEGGDNPALVGAFTIIDHSKWTDKNGKEYKNQLRLLVAKRQTIKKLQTQAVKRGGLAGVTFDISRTDGNEANVGDVFDFVGKSDLVALFEKFGHSVFDYTKIIEYKTGKELRQMGFGATVAGAEVAPQESTATAAPSATMSAESSVENTKAVAPDAKPVGVIDFDKEL